MTTHVFIVDKNTFKYHLEYMFVGTGADDKKDKDGNIVKIESINSLPQKLHHATENKLMAMVADSQRLRFGDDVIFYVVLDKKKSISEGKFYGVFKVKESFSFLDENNDKQFLLSALKKSLFLRAFIEPKEVYENGVSEWEALDSLVNIKNPYEMLWSLIYRKLKANRGNTMITIYESERLQNLIKNKNNGRTIIAKDFTFDSNKQSIVVSKKQFTYSKKPVAIKILPRLIYKYSKNKKTQFESHLQAYIIQNLEKINIFAKEKIEWIGNEVSCGVGMQRIDIMLSVIRKDEKVCIPIELKSSESSLDITKQLKRYIDWLKQYYLPNVESIIEPMIISRKFQNKKENYNELINEFKNFNQKNSLKIRYVEFDVDVEYQTINFNEINY